MAHLPKLSFLLKSAPMFNSRFRHSRFLVGWTDSTEIIRMIKSKDNISVHKREGGKNETKGEFHQVRKKEKH